MNRYVINPSERDKTVDSVTRLLNACQGKDVDRTPVWFMRQAGRIFPEYRELRSDHSFMEICRTPELTSQVTRMPVERLGVDAAIIFADIMLPLHAMGIDFELVKGTGPVIGDPIRTPADVNELSVCDPADEVSYLGDGISRTRADLPDTIPLIGFAGAPFTLACYLIQGRPSRTFNRAKEFMFSHPDVFNDLIKYLSETLNKYIQMQTAAGIDVFQLFDSWVGILSPRHFRQHIKSHVSEIFEQLKEVPGIYFGTGTPSLLKDMADTGPDVLGLDWRIEIKTAIAELDQSIPLQGNLDPSMMLTPFERIQPTLKTILDQAQQCPGYIFNLGHGFNPNTSVDVCKRVVDYVKEYTASLEPRA